MRIGLVAGALYRGAPERVVCQLAVALRRLGEDVHVYSLSPAGHAGEHLTRAGVRLWSGAIRAGGLWSGLALARQLWRDRVQVLSTHDVKTANLLVPLAYLLRIPAVQTLYGSVGDGEAQVDAPCPGGTAVALSAESLRAAIRNKKMREAAVHVPIGADCPPVDRDESRAFAARLCGKPCDGPLIVQIGAIAQERDPLSLVQAFSTVREQHPAAQLVLAGPILDPEYERLVRTAVRALELQGAVTLTGFIVDAWRLLAGADVACRVSRADGAPLSVIEAFSFGTPVLATTVGDLARAPRGVSHSPGCEVGLIEHSRTGVLVPPQDADAISAGLLELLAKSELRAELGANALAEHRRVFTAIQQAQRYRALFTAMLVGTASAARRASKGRVPVSAKFSSGRPPVAAASSSDCPSLAAESSRSRPPVAAVVPGVSPAPARP